MNVTLVRYTNEPQEAIELAAANCYNSKPNGKIMKSCYESGHKSVLEFAQFHFHIEGISRACSHQLVRSRTFSFAQRSQRWVQENGFDYVTPNTILHNHQAKASYDRLMHQIESAYEELQRFRIPNEDARFVLPNACETTIDVSCDFRNLCHFMNERLCKKAQWEIRELAQKMKECVVEVFPEAVSMLVPKCEMNNIHFCTEKKPCGRHAKLEDMLHQRESDGE